eukprot:TRINITY_DN6255_c0_g1_i1.p1 TRINITY_DN6255_c0_g1~~TRINITY_DN6255_c0_g1_i1.p1  ORF type:complete len:209 (-),score=27.76 TRINITY_DN6255_c0_g1_i1:38-664(-)
MSVVVVHNVKVEDNPAPFLHDLKFEITIECFQNLKEDLDWKIIYVGSAESEDCDQVLDSISLGPVQVGTSIFTFVVPPPDPAKIPKSDLLGVTVIIVTCAYRGNEFIRIGYYVYNEYDESFPELRENPPSDPEVKKVIRNIRAESPKVTHLPINWFDDLTNNNSISNENSHTETKEFLNGSSSNERSLPYENNNVKENNEPEEHRVEN